MVIERDHTNKDFPLLAVAVATCRTLSVFNRHGHTKDTENVHENRTRNAQMSVLGEIKHTDESENDDGVCREWLVTCNAHRTFPIARSTEYKCL